MWSTALLQIEQNKIPTLIWKYPGGCSLLLSSADTLPFGIVSVDQVYISQLMSFLRMESLRVWHLHHSDSCSYVELNRRVLKKYPGTDRAHQTFAEKLCIGAHSDRHTAHLAASHSMPGRMGLVDVNTHEQRQAQSSTVSVASNYAGCTCGGHQHSNPVRNRICLRRGVNPHSYTPTGKQELRNGWFD